MRIGHDGHVVDRQGTFRQSPDLFQSLRFNVVRVQVNGNTVVVGLRGREDAGQGVSIVASSFAFSVLQQHPSGCQGSLWKASVARHRSLYFWKKMMMMTTMMIAVMQASSSQPLWLGWTDDEPSCCGSCCCCCELVSLEVRERVRNGIAFGIVSHWCHWIACSHRKQGSLLASQRARFVAPFLAVAVLLLWRSGASGRRRLVPIIAEGRSRRTRRRTADFILRRRIERTEQTNRPP